MYVTNAVEHFRHETRGKRRIHQKPDRKHVEACRPWLDAELELVRPQVLVCLGARQEDDRAFVDDLEVAAAALAG